MTLTPFPGLKAVRPAAARISDVTLRDFSGGLRVTDNELSLKNKYATVLQNMLVNPDTSQSVRFGTKEFATCSADVVNMTYFRQSIVSILSNGEVQRIADDGAVTTVWDTAIANALPGHPAGWSASISAADFSEFRGDLIITNGQDKPIIIDDNFEVSYLQDLATGSNINVPITNHVTTVSNYLVMAGRPSSDDASTVYVSSTGTSGTWPGDAAPNDSISFDVGAYTGQASQEIHGLGSFKDYLVIFFENFFVLLQLGTFSSTNVHEPVVAETFNTLGTINSKTMLVTENTLIFAATTGIYSVERDVYGATLKTVNIADNLGHDYVKVLGLVNKKEPDCFIVNDALSKTAFYSFTQSDGTVKCYAMRYHEDFKKLAWSEITGWTFSNGCASEKGRVFFAKGSKLFQYGNEVFEQEAFTTDAGDPIDFVWEFPWLDAGNRIKTKQLRKLTFDTTGTSAFSLQCFVNNFYKNHNGDLDPAGEMSFVAGSAGGYGNNANGYGGDGFGGGRRANDERFFGIPIKFKILKLRISGKAVTPLRVVSLSLIYSKGNYNL